MRVFSSSSLRISKVFPLASDENSEKMYKAISKIKKVNERERALFLNAEWVLSTASIYFDHIMGYHTSMGRQKLILL